MDKHKCSIVRYLALVVYDMVLYVAIDFRLSWHDIHELYIGQEASEETSFETVNELTNTDLSRSTEMQCETLSTYPVLDIEYDDFSCTKAIRGERQEKSFSQQPVDNLHTLLQQNCTVFTRNRQYLTKVRTDYLKLY